MSCYQFEGTHYVRNRHFAECDGADECAGCLRCPESHCGECRKGTHLGFGEHTCPECVGKARASLRAILDLYADLPAEAEVKGVNSEAANLHGPAADPESWSWRKAYLVKTLPLDQIPEDDQHHPLNVLGGWVYAIGQDYGDQPDRALTLAEQVDYLDRRLGRIANDVGQDFGQFRREIQRCRAHLEAVLHDGLQIDTGAPCMKCSVPLIREWGMLVAADGWRCPKCREWRSDKDYRLNVADLHRTEATWLTAHDMEIRTGVKPGALRVRATRGDVQSKRENGRVVYLVADVLKRPAVEAS